MKILSAFSSFLRLCALSLLGTCGVAISQPVVSNVTASQSVGTRSVAIGYTLRHPQSLPCTVTIQVSRDNGSIWEVVASVSGAVGAGVPSTTGATGKSVTWNVGSNWPAQVFSEVKVRLIADDGQGGGPSLSSYAAIMTGAFVMGDSFGDQGDSNELPRRVVNVSAFYLAKKETTKAEWDDVWLWGATHGYTDLPSGSGKAANHPIVDVSWHDVVKWINAKSEKDGLTPVYYINDTQTMVYRVGNVNISSAQVKWNSNGYRLPTEAEWEKAGRGGLTGKRFPWGDTITHEQANYNSTQTYYYAYDLSGDGYHPSYQQGRTLYFDNFPYTSPVGSFAANGYGLFDMAGNVQEWCWDWYGSHSSAAVTDPTGPPSGNSRVFRGGSWSRNALYARTANKFNGSWSPESRGNDVGFRLARSQATSSMVSQSDSPAFSLDLRNVGDFPSISAYPTSQSASAGGSVTFSVTASGTAPLAYQWLRDGAAVSGATNATFTLTNVQNTSAGSYTVLVSNSAGSLTSTAATLTVTEPETAPTITRQPAEQVAAVGANVAFQVSVGGTAPFTYQWRKDGAMIVGASLASLVLTNVAATNAGSYTVLVSNSAGTATSNPATLSIGTGPLITTVPVGQAAAVGSNVSFVVAASGTAPLSYQWLKDGRPIIGANNATLALSTVTNADAGSYSVAVTNSVGTMTSRAVTLVVSAPSSRLANLSVRTGAGAGNQTLIVGFVLSGEGGTKPVLVRGIGPSLSAFGVAGALDDPQLTLYRGTIPVAANDNWGDSPLVLQISQAANAVGAFTIDQRSRDAALYAGLQPGSYTAQMSSTSGSGIALVELYEGDDNPLSRLVNVSARCTVGTGANTLIAGFVIAGNAPKTVLLRGSGPTLSAFGVSDTLADPQLVLLRGADVLATNDDWWRDGGAQSLPLVFASVGAFSLAPQSRDAALVTTLQPGQYSIQVSGAGGTTGVALVELYEVP